MSSPVTTCDPNLAVLLSNNVYDSAPKEVVPGKFDGFQLQQPDIFASCQNDLKNAIETFCMIPQEPLLGTNPNSMCSLNAQTGVPDSLFERLVMGKIQHPDDMYAIAEGAFFDVKSDDEVPQPWVTVAANAIHTNLPGDDYLGMRGVRQATLKDFSVSNIADILLLIDGGQAYTNDSDGLLRPIAGIAGVNNEAPRTAVNARGRVRAAMFSDHAFVFVNNAWHELNLNKFTPEDLVGYGLIRMWEVIDSSSPTAPNIVHLALFYTTSSAWALQLYQFHDSTTNNSSTWEKPLFSFGEPNPNPGNDELRFRTTFLGLTADNSAIVCATTPQRISDFLYIHLIDLSNPAAPVASYKRWQTPPTSTMGRFMETQFIEEHDFRSMVFMDGSVADLKLLVIMDDFRVQMELVASNVFPIQYTDGGIGESPILSENLSRSKRLWVEGGELFSHVNGIDVPLVIPNQNASFSLSNAQPYIFAISPDGTDVWIFRDSKLWRLNSPTAIGFGNQWTSTFSLFYSDFAKTSDFGLPTLDNAKYNAGESWYKGTNTAANDIPLVKVFGTEVARAPHETYRYILQKPKKDAVPLPTFLYAVADLQRANEFVIAATKGVAVKLFNSGNWRVDGSATRALFESHTFDHGSTNPDEFQVLDMNASPFATTSPNGQYILYVTSDKRMRLVNNSFNNERFANWCALNVEDFDNALLYQSNLCFNALKDQTPGSTDFVDARCNCVGRNRLFELAFPHANEVPQALLAPVAENLPCIINGCSDSFIDDDADTNVSTMVKTQCNNRQFQICSTVFQIGKGSSLINVSKIHEVNCTLNHFQECKGDNSCGPGMTCRAGRCTTSCTSNAQCQKILGSLITSTCQNGVCQQVATAPKKPLLTWWLIMVIVLAVLIVSLLFGIMVAAGRRSVPIDIRPRFETSIQTQ